MCGLFAIPVEIPQKTMPAGIFHLFADRLEGDGFFPVVRVQALGDISDAALGWYLGACSEIPVLHVPVDARPGSRLRIVGNQEIKEECQGVPGSTWKLQGSAALSAGFSFVIRHL
jgi:hypothetical protein